jgi:orotate phosphoribosyltransferase
MTSSQNIAALLLEAGAVLLRPDEPFTFASGLRSPIYCDNRLMLGEVAARRTITAAFAAQCDGAEIVAGTATAGIPWAAWAAEATSLPLAYVRGTAKGHGRGRQIEGADVAGRRVVLLEDTISTGESSLQAAAALREAGANLLRCVCIFTWGWAATDARFREAGLELHALARIQDMLAVATERGALTSEQRQLVESWAADPQGWTEELHHKGPEE